MTFINSEIAREIRRFFVRVLLLSLLLPVISLSSCSSFKPFHAPYEEESSLVFGHIDMGEAYSDLRWITMKRIKPITDKQHYGFYVEKGLFYRTFVPRGLYKFGEFGGHSFRLGDMTHRFPEQGKHQMDPAVKAPGIYYVGSYKYRKVKAPLLEVRYVLERTASPGERELLEQLLVLAVHPSWKEKIKKRIREVQQ